MRRAACDRRYAIPAGDACAAALASTPTRWVALANEMGQVLQWSLDRPGCAACGSWRRPASPSRGAGRIARWRPGGGGRPAPSRVARRTTKARRTAPASTGGPLFTVTFTPDAQAVVAGGSDGAIYIWLFNQPEVAPMVLPGPHGRRERGGGEPGRALAGIRRCGQSRAALAGRPPGFADPWPPRTMRPSACSTLAATPRAWHPATAVAAMQWYDLTTLPETAQRLPSQTGRVSAMDFSLNGRWLATGDENACRAAVERPTTRRSAARGVSTSRQQWTRLRGSAGGERAVSTG